MKKVGIYTNFYKDSDKSITNNIIEILKENEFDYVCFSQDTEDINNCDFSDLNCLIIIGGDGTILYNVTPCIKADIPMLTINKGTFGFLSEVPSESLEKVIDLINRENVLIEERDVLHTVVNGEDHYALNEVIIERHTFSRIITIAVEVDGHLVNEFKGDGFIVSTPTGSTGYSLSAGGSIISPKAAVIALTPLNCVSLTARPIIVSSDETVKLTLTDAQRDGGIFADGHMIGFLKKGESITIKTDFKKLKFLRSSDFTFYRKLIKRLI